MPTAFYKKLWFKILAIALVAVIAIPCTLRAGIDVLAATYTVWSPDYEKLDISPILEKESLTDEDYEILFQQTGLTKIAIDDFRSAGKIRNILSIQRQFFAKPDFHCYIFHFCVGMFEKNSGVYPSAILQDGDIIYSPSTYISFVNISHSAIVVDGGKKVVEAYGYGNPTQYKSSSSFFIYPEFVILRPKAGSELGRAVAEYVESDMLSVPYDILTGIFGDKAPDPLKTTHCSHLPWYAYNKFGIDLDSNGGKIVTPADILNSPYLEVVQVFGMDIEKFK